MCRTGGRRCPSHSNPEQIAARNARRRASYAATKHKPSPSDENNPVTFDFTEAQTNYFANSVAKTNTGELVKLYHGSAHEFTSFDPKTLGKGNDSWGNGFYFTSNEATARGYMSESESPDANVKEFYLNLKNPIYVDGKTEMSLTNVRFPSKVAAAVLKQHPLAYIQPNDEDGEMSFLGDYSPTYWDKEEWTKEEINQMIDEVAENYFNDVSWVELESTFGREHGSEFLHAMHKETTHDGVIVDFGEDGKHYVAWFPEQMKLTSNQNPTVNVNFSS